MRANKPALVAAAALFVACKAENEVRQRLAIVGEVLKQYYDVGRNARDGAPWRANPDLRAKLAGVLGPL